MKKQLNKKRKAPLVQEFACDGWGYRDSILGSCYEGSKSFTICLRIHDEYYYKCLPIWAIKIAPFAISGFPTWKYNRLK